MTWLRMAYYYCLFRVEQFRINTSDRPYRRNFYDDWRKR